MLLEHQGWSKFRYWMQSVCFVIRDAKPAIVAWCKKERHSSLKRKLRKSGCGQFCDSEQGGNPLKIQASWRLPALIRNQLIRNQLLEACKDSFFTAWSYNAATLLKWKILQALPICLAAPRVCKLIIHWSFQSLTTQSSNYLFFREVHDFQCPLHFQKLPLHPLQLPLH